MTHLPQLEQVVQGAYGTTIDAHAYLEKFYQLRVTLPEDSDQPARQLSAYVPYLWNALGIEFRDAAHSSQVQQELQALVNVHDLSLRRLERVMTHIVLVAATVGQRVIIEPLVAGLCVMRQTHPALYGKARMQGLTWAEARKFLQPTEGQGVQNEWTLALWKYATGEEDPQEEKDYFLRIQAQYHMYGREKIIPLMASYIDDLGAA